MDGKEKVLEPCSHCGEVPTLKDHGVWITIVCPVGSPCMGSGLITMMLDTHAEKAIDCWNRRAGR